MFRSPRNLASGNLESEQETHPCKMSLRHKGRRKEWVTQQEHTPVPFTQNCSREPEDGEKTHTCLFLYPLKETVSEAKIESALEYTES